MTLAFLENQLASALTLQSAQEYRYWLLIYARFLVNEGTKPSPSFEQIRLVKDAFCEQEKNKTQGLVVKNKIISPTV